MSWVIDASFTATLFLPDEHTETSDTFFDLIGDDNIIFVPQLWWYEIGNVLVTAVRRQRLSSQKMITALTLLERLPLTIVDTTGLKPVLDIAIAHQLSVYDATYLALALEKDIGLVSFDRQLNQVATKLGVETYVP